jgi:hypothetical protein
LKRRSKDPEVKTHTHTCSVEEIRDDLKSLDGNEPRFNSANAGFPQSLESVEEVGDAESLDASHLEPEEAEPESLEEEAHMQSTPEVIEGEEVEPESLEELPREPSPEPVEEEKNNRQVEEVEVAEVIGLDRNVEAVDEDEEPSSLSVAIVDAESGVDLSRESNAGHIEEDETELMPQSVMVEDMEIIVDAEKESESDVEMTLAAFPEHVDEFESVIVEEAEILEVVDLDQKVDLIEEVETEPNYLEDLPMDSTPIAIKEEETDQLVESLVVEEAEIAEVIDLERNVEVVEEDESKPEYIEELPREPSPGPVEEFEAKIVDSFVVEVVEVAEVIGLDRNVDAVDEDEEPSSEHLAIDAESVVDLSRKSNNEHIEVVETELLSQSVMVEDMEIIDDAAKESESSDEILTRGSLPVPVEEVDSVMIEEVDILEVVDLDRNVELEDKQLVDSVMVEEVEIVEFIALDLNDELIEEGETEPESLEELPVESTPAVIEEVETE